MNSPEMMAHCKKVHEKMENAIQNAIPRTLSKAHDQKEKKVNPTSPIKKQISQEFSEIEKDPLLIESNGNEIFIVTEEENEIKNGEILPKTEKSQAKTIENHTKITEFQTKTGVNQPQNDKKSTYNGGPSLKCPKCSEYFWSENRLNYHIYNIHEKPTESNENDKIGESSNSIIASSFWIFKCTNCLIELKTKREIDKHIEKLHQNKFWSFTCMICKIVRYTKNSIEEHIKIAHKNESFFTNYIQGWYNNIRYLNQFDLS